MLSELEEVISYKEATAAGNVDRRNVIQKTWMKRCVGLPLLSLRPFLIHLLSLKGCKRDVDVWQRILKVRALVVTPRENTEMWVKFANLCRKSGRLGLADKTLNSLLGDAHMATPVRVCFAPIDETC